MGAHAIVFGASGLNGWAVVNQLLSNDPNQGTFDKVTALTNRQLDPSRSYWPAATPSSPTLTLASGINLSVGTHEDLAHVLRLKMADPETVTHLFFCAHKACSDLVDEARINVEILERTVRAVASLTPALQFVVYPGGAMAYGIFNPGGYFQPPLREDVPRLRGSKGDIIPYYGMRDTLTRLSAGKAWTWAEMMMDAIIGFAPNGSGWSLAGHWAIWLSCYRIVEGEGAKVHFPGTVKGYKARFNEISADKIARQAIWASLNPDRSGEQIYNVADRVPPSSHEERWPIIARSFGLQGIGPAEHPEEQLKPGEYIKENGHVLKDRGFDADLVHLPGHLDGYSYHMDFDRHFSMEKIRAAGFVEESDPNESWIGAFQMFRKAGLIPEA